MTFQDFDKFQSDLIAEVVGMRNTKGKEYANSVDRFANFRRLSEQLGISDYKVAWVYAVKHLDSISSFIKNGQVFSAEPIRGRIVDALVYLTLIAGMIEESEHGKDDVKLLDENAGKHQPMEYDPTPEKVEV